MGDISLAKSSRRQNYPKDINGKRYCHGCDKWHPATREYFSSSAGSLSRSCKKCLAIVRKIHNDKMSKHRVMLSQIAFH